MHSVGRAQNHRKEPAVRCRVPNGPWPLGTPGFKVDIERDGKVVCRQRSHLEVEEQSGYFHNRHTVARLIRSGGHYGTDPQAVRVYEYLHESGEVRWAVFYQADDDDVVTSPFVIDYVKVRECSEGEVAPLGTFVSAAAVRREALQFISGVFPVQIADAHVQGVEAVCGWRYWHIHFTDEEGKLDTPALAIHLTRSELALCGGVVVEGCLKTLSPYVEKRRRVLADVRDAHHHLTGLEVGHRERRLPERIDLLVGGFLQACDELEVKTCGTCVAGDSCRRRATARGGGSTAGHCDQWWPAGLKRPGIEQGQAELPPHVRRAVGRFLKWLCTHGIVLAAWEGNQLGLCPSREPSLICCGNMLNLALSWTAVKMMRVPRISASRWIFQPERQYVSTGIGR